MGRPPRRGATPLRELQRGWGMDRSLCLAGEHARSPAESGVVQWRGCGGQEITVTGSAVMSAL